LEEVERGKFKLKLNEKYITGRIEITQSGSAYVISPDSENDIFKDFENPMQVMRYHSLLLQDLPLSLISLASTDKNELMAFRHSTLPIWGLQFHPESILSPSGLRLLENWMRNVQYLSK
jgi:anthranilate/para-aminobenzoate synthase component II